MKRELQVAFSRNAQPLWVRIVKWMVILWATWRYHHTRAYRFWAVGTVVAGLTVHFFIRHKTHGWTKPWGGWNDPAFVIPDPAVPEV